MQICFLTQQNSSGTEFFGIEGPSVGHQASPGLIEFNRDYDAFSFHQLAENISDLLQQADHLRQRAL